MCVRITVYEKTATSCRQQLGPDVVNRIDSLQQLLRRGLDDGFVGAKPARRGAWGG